MLSILTTHGNGAQGQERPGRVFSFAGGVVIVVQVEMGIGHSSPFTAHSFSTPMLSSAEVVVEATTNTAAESMGVLKEWALVDRNIAAVKAWAVAVWVR